jgi:hypothetical protein
MVDNIDIDHQKVFISFVRSWLTLLSQGRWKEACELIDEPNCYGISWTPERIRHLIEQDIYGAESRFAREHPKGIIYANPGDLEEPRETELIKFSDGSGYAIDYDLPLNGEWSDIAVQFHFLKREHGFAVILHDIHVL